MCSLLLTACNHETPTQEPEMPENPPVEQVEQPEASDKNKVPFSYEEISTIFNMQEKDVLAIYGEPKEIIESSYWEDSTSKEYVYDENRFGFVCYAETGESYLYFACLADNLIRAPRNIRIGDSVAEVMGAFPAANGDDGRYLLEGYSEEGTAEYQLLYGEYTYMEQYAIAIYQNDSLVEIEYADQGAVVRLHIADEKLASIEYMISLM